jgi:hypothetical protein
VHSLLVLVVLMLQYNRLTYGDNPARVSTVSGEDFDAFYGKQQGQFDVAFSMSALDHDGE